MPASPPPSTRTPARQADRVSAVLLLLFALFVIAEARILPYWTANAPGPGFLPFWLGVLLASASVVMFARTIRRGGPEGPPHTADVHSLPDRATTIRIAAVVGLTAAAAALSLFVGLVLAGGLFMGVTLAYLRPGHSRANWAAAIVTPLVIWLLFVRWLGVPLPAGPLGF